MCIKMPDHAILPVPHAVDALAAYDLLRCFANVGAVRKACFDFACSIETLGRTFAQWTPLPGHVNETSKLFPRF